ncbi:hypothetical protein BH24ACI3_BH24ACI3_08090 [soil metagenome]
MINKSTISRLSILTFAVAGSILAAGQFIPADAQTRDPFAKPAWARTREVRTGTVATVSGVTGSAEVVSFEKRGPAEVVSVGKRGPAEVVNQGAPPIEQRIAHFKQIREQAAMNGQELPKVTSVITLDEMAVTGIFKTPRGYAAMVEATPIQLSYTIYPGERFFDGQLVAVEENRLIFRKVTKMSNGKFIASVENMPLRQYTQREQIQGTAPLQDTSANSAPQRAASEPVKVASSGPIVSLLDQKANQKPADEAPAKSEKGKRPTRVANRKN